MGSRQDPREFGSLLGAASDPIVLLGELRMKHILADPDVPLNAAGLAGVNLDHTVFPPTPESRPRSILPLTQKPKAWRCRGVVASISTAVFNAQMIVDTPTVQFLNCAGSPLRPGKDPSVFEVIKNRDQQHFISPLALMKAP